MAHTDQTQEDHNGTASMPRLIQPSLDRLADELHQSCSASVLDGYIAIEASPLPRLPPGKLSKQALRQKYQDAADYLPKVR